MKFFFGLRSNTYPSWRLKCSAQKSYSLWCERGNHCNNIQPFLPFHCSAPHHPNINITVDMQGREFCVFQWLVPSLQNFHWEFQWCPRAASLAQVFPGPLLVKGEHARLKEGMIWLQMRQPPVLLPHFHSSPCSRCPRKRDDQTQREVGELQPKHLL